MHNLYEWDEGEIEDALGPVEKGQSKNESEQRPAGDGRRRVLSHEDVQADVHQAEIGWLGEHTERKGDQNWAEGHERETRQHGRRLCDS